MKKNSFFSFIFGVLSGIIIGILIAPDSGINTRNIIKSKTQDTNDAFKKKINSAKYDISGVTDTIKDTINLYTGSSIKELDEDNYFEKEFDV